DAFRDRVEVRPPVRRRGELVLEALGLRAPGLMSAGEGELSDQGRPRPGELALTSLDREVHWMDHDLEVGTNELDESRRKQGLARRIRRRARGPFLAPRTATTHAGHGRRS